MTVKQFLNEMRRSCLSLSGMQCLTEMQSRGISQAEIAAELRINRRTVKKIISGAKIERHAAQRAAFSLGISLSRFEILGEVRDDFEAVKCKYRELREMARE